MKVLHLYSNYKWTGPADLALLQAHALHRHAPGVEVEFAIASWTHPGQPHAMRRRAEELELPLREGLALRRHYRLGSILNDSYRLATWLDERGYDVLHCHQGGDHLLAALACAWSGRPAAIVRSFWEDKLPPRLGRALFSFQRTAALLGSLESRTVALAERFDQLPRACLRTLPPILDAAFDRPSAEQRQAARSALETELGIAPGDFVVGLTARIQRKRRWDLAWDTIAALRERVPHARLCVLGRPDEGVFDELCTRPIAERGLSEHVHFLGYRAGEDYRRALAGFDAFLFLVAGSDATSRALREAMATGLPPVTTDAPPLPELLGEGRHGSVCRADPAELATALAELAEDPELRRRRGEQAHAAARARSLPEAQAAALEELYRLVVPGKGA
jgi:glycosyltransferase involved in cell wall biosynthesis